MVKIELKSLHLKNFKGIKDLKIDFDNITNISGENATGKTTINDAFRWLLFDKDSTDRKQFEIKTIDKAGNVIHGLEHSVTGELFINGQLKIYQKIYKEKWQKKRGDTDSTFTGHETIYSINDVPVKAQEFQEEISSLIDEEIFKLITNPLYFSTIMKWQDRREKLLNIVGDITNDEIIDSETSLKNMKELFEAEKDFDKLKKGIAATKKKLNDEIKMIPVRIDECNNSIVDIDFNIIKIELESKEVELSDIEDQLTDASKENPALAEKKKELNSLRAKISEIENDHTEKRYAEAQKLNSNLRKHQSDKSELENSLKEIENKITSFENKRDVLAKEIKNCAEIWDRKKAEQFIIDENFMCPTCKRKLDDDVIENKKAELLENFNSEKAKKLEEISKDGKIHTEQKFKAESQLKDFEQQKIETKKAIEELINKITEAKEAIEEFENTEMEYPEFYWAYRAQVEEITEIINTPADSSIDVNDLRLRKTELIKEIDLIKTELRAEENNIKMRKRIEELSDREKELAQKIADLENNEFLCEKFIKTKVELLDQKINSMFSFVRFKLFDIQINGGLVETCEALINGVPFSDANNAGKINAGIDIINALSDYYEVSAPIFIDNREAVNQIIKTDAQVINLIVSKDPKLVVKSGNEALELTH